MLQLTFLGTSGGSPTVERGLPSIALRYESALLLFDCGEGTQRQMMKYKVGYGSISSIFITHPHLDHYLGMFGLLETLKMSSPAPKPVDLFIPKGIDIENFEKFRFAKSNYIKRGEIFHSLSGNGFTIDAFPIKHCKNSFGFVFQERDKVKFHEEKAHSLGLNGNLFKEIQKKGKVKTNKGEISLEDVSWIKPGRKIVYTGDCAPDTNTIDAAKGADLLIHESTFDSSRKVEAAERLHSTAEGAAEIAKKAGVKKLVLTHISPRYSGSSGPGSGSDPDSDINQLLEEARLIYTNTVIAKDGDVIDI
ncbi:ribonuclease Z [Candidatus Micrarchaeota archaeon]|nr:ribonuclease Z [Candidatus Micrarchaeota archaeon]